MHSLCDFHGLEKIKVEEAITEKYRPEPGFEPQVSRFAHEHSTTELFRSIQFCYLNLGLFLIALVLYRMKCHPRVVSGCGRGTCM